MLKKLLAGVSALALALGMIALVAGPASAHTNTINASVACNADDGTYTITWKVKNSEASNPETITASSNTAVVPLGTQIAGGGTGTFTQTVSSAGNYSLTLTGTWTNDNWVDESSGSISRQDFPRSCTPQLVKVTICHATPPDTAAQGWTPIKIDDDAIDNHASHFTEHDADIIPAYDYWVQDHGVWTKLHFAGKNLTTVFYGATGAQILAAGCAVPVTPAAPTFTPAVCTDGASGNGSYTIPTTVGVDYSVSTDGGAHYTPKSAGTYSVTPILTVLVKATLTPATKDIYELVGTASWSYTFDSAGDCVTIPATPSVTSQVCTVNEDGSGAYASGYIIIPATANVQYYIDGSPVSSGDQHLAPGTFTVTATATGGYALSSYPEGGWSLTIAPALPCGNVTPADPTVTNQTCSVDESGKGSYTDGAITVPASTTVSYFIDGLPVSAGSHPQAPGTYTVTAVANPDYALTGYPDGGWSLTVESALPCGDLITHPDVIPMVAFTQMSCTANGSYTLSNDLGDAEAVVWTVDGSPVAQGTYQVTSGRTVTVHAEPNGPDFGFDVDTQKDWSFTFAAPTACDLKTLALTGTTPIGGLALGYFLLIAGIGVATVRTVRRRSLGGSQE